MLFALTKGFMLGLAIALPVGPTNVEAIRRTCERGARAAFLFLLGMILVLFGFLLLLSFGLSAFVSGPIVQPLLAIIGTLVIFYLAIASLRIYWSARREVAMTNSAVPATFKKDFMSGVLLTAGNPGVLAIWAGILGADLVLNHASRGIIILTSLGILIADFCFVSLLILITQYSRRFLTRDRERYVSLLAGLILLFFGIKFGLAAIRLFV